MAFTVLVALGLIGIALIGFVAIVTLLYFAVLGSSNARKGRDASNDSTEYIVANPNEQNPYAPTSVSAAKRTSDFRRTAFMVFVVFGILLTTLLIIAFAMLSWRWSAVA